MNWYFKFISSAAEIHPYNYENWDEYQESIGMEPIDPEIVGTEAERSFSESKINLDRNKDISRVVMLDGKVIGSIASGWSVYDKVAKFAFDMAIKPEYRGNVSLLFRMIEEGIKMFRQDAGDYEEMGNYVEMVVWVVNRRLIKVLERFGFEVDEDYGDGGAHMSYRP